MNFFQRFMTAVLGLLLLIGVFAACSSSSDDGKGDDSTQAETQPPSADDVYELLGIAEENRDYDGATYKIAYTQRMFSDNESEVGYTFEELDGGVLSQAVWNRNQKVNSLLNVEIEAHYCPWDAMADECERAVIADDGRFELICTRIEQQTLLAEAGYLKNILNVDTIDTTAAWWNQQGVERFTFFDEVLYFIYGDINYFDDYGITAMVFNKDSFEDNNWEFPYETVREGDWTFDKLLTYVQGASKDLNPTGVWDENDYYGLTTNAGYIINFLMGFGDDLATMSADGSTFELTPLNFTTAQGIVSRAYEIFDALATSPDVVNADRDYGYEITDAIFSEGRALFNTTLLGAIGDLPKHSGVNYGILPLPKYDEEQASYHAPLTTSWATAYSIFVKCRDVDLAGYIMSAMSYYGQDMKKFLRAYYGDGCENIYDYLVFLEDCTGELHIPYNPTALDSLDIEKFVSAIDTYRAKWDEAEALASDDEIKENIRRSRMQFTYLVLELTYERDYQKGTAETKSTYTTMAKEFFEAAKGYNMWFRENMKLPTAPDFTKPPSQWQ